MRKLLLLLVLSIGIGNCGEATTDDPTSPNSDDRCYHNGNRLYEGPQGGCYYINSNGNKTYVDRAECAGC